MGNHSDGSPNHSGTVATAGQNEVEKFQDPGIPPHRLRLADTDPKAAKRAERQVAVLFGASVVGTLIFLVAYFAIDLGEGTSIATIRLQNALLGVGTAFAMLGIGTGLVHWAKALMPDHEVSEERHPIRTEADRLAAVRLVADTVDKADFVALSLHRVDDVLAPPAEAYDGCVDHKVLLGHYAGATIFCCCCPKP